MGDRPPTLHAWAVRALCILLVGGSLGAAYRALTWSERPRNRTLVVVAPTQTSVALMDGNPPLSDTDGVHSFSVAPGPIRLDIRHPAQAPQTIELTVPRGIGGLMIDLRFDRNGDVTVGYF